MLPIMFSLIGATLASTCQEISGNWFCDETTQVTYTGLGGVAGSYQRVTDMDTETCTCSQASQAFSGALSPLDEDLSMHFRGPIQLAEFAVYTMTTSGTASEKRRRSLTRKRGQSGREKAIAKRDQYIYTLIPPICTTSDYQETVTDVSTATQVEIATEAVTTTQQAGNVATPETTTTTADDVETATTADNAAETTAAVPTATADEDQLTTIGTAVVATSDATTAEVAEPTTTAVVVASPTTTSSSSTTTATAAAATGSTIWSRTSYYNAAAGVVDNAVFMNNMGGVDGDNGTSGTWSSCFGNSLSYASTSGLSTSSDPITLGDVTLPSDTEVIIFSGEACTTETCGYVPDGVPAYLGFGGSNKMFLFDFTMPSDTADTDSFNGNMPAIWALNAQIPRSQQYGSCSCWETGCGELDLFEVLTGSPDYMKTTFHSVSGGGGSTSDYFERPTSGYMKAAVIFISATKEIQIIELDSSVEFSDELVYDIYDDWQQSYISEVTLTD